MYHIHLAFTLNKINWNIKILHNSLSCANDCSDSGDSTNFQFAM